MRAWYEEDRNRIRLDFPNSRDRAKVLRNIDARYDFSEKVWSSTPNPCLAHRLTQGGWECDDFVRNLSESYDRVMQAAENAKHADSLEQPPIRKFDLWKHQVRAYHFAYPQDACMLTMDMGTGKSAVAIALAQNWGSKKILIVCPKAVMPVWRRELAKHCVLPYRLLVCDHGTVAQKQERAEEFMNEDFGDDMQVVVVNYDSAKFRPYCRWSASIDWDLVIADESHRCKGYRSQTTKFMTGLHDASKKRLALTGTPMPHNPMDIFGQFCFIDKALFGSDYTSFRDRYAEMDQIYQSKVLRWINQDELKAKFHSRSFRVEASEVLDLPEIVHCPVPVELEPETRRVYRGMNDTMKVALQSGYITAANAAVKMIRLQQITSGFCIVNEDSLRVVGTEKRDALRDLLVTVPDTESVVVFCQFARDLATVRSVAEECGMEYGEVSGVAKDITSEGTMPENIRVMGVQYAAGGVGIDLTKARYCIMYSQTWNLGTYDQSIARIHRPGQTKTTTVYHLICRGTIDPVIMHAVHEKRSVVDAVMDQIPVIEDTWDGC